MKVRAFLAWVLVDVGYPIHQDTEYKREKACFCVCVCVCVWLTYNMKDGERTEIVRDRFNLRLDSSNAA